MSFYCTAEHCFMSGMLFHKGIIKCTAHDCKDRTEPPSCSTCKWHDSFSWVCYNGLSERRADFTDPEDVCKEWEKREDDDRRENQKAQT